MNPGEFPHSEISGSMLICSSPKLIAAYHVFHRLPVPRHSPCALVRLTIQTILFREWLVFPLDSFLPTKIIVTLPFEIVIFLKKELTIIFVSQLLFSFQGTSYSFGLLPVWGVALAVTIVYLKTECFFRMHSCGSIAADF